MSVVLARETDSGVASIEIDLSVSTAMMITVRLDGDPANFEILHFHTVTDRDAAFNRLVTGLDGDGYAVLT